MGGLIAALIVGGVAGWLAGMIMKGKGLGVLVPGRGEPVSGQGHGKATAHHEAEEARPGTGYQARVGPTGQGLDHLFRVLGLVRQRLV